MTPTDTSSRAAASLRRLLVHALAVLGVLLTASGSAGLLRIALERAGGPSLLDHTAEGLARGLSLVIVGLPLWLLGWHLAQRGARADQTERHTRARRLHLAVVRLVALIIALVHAYGVGLWLMGAEPYDAAALARLVVWTAVWVHHERVAAEVPFGSRATRRLDRLHVYLTGAIGLALLAGGAATVAARSLGVIYDRLVRPEAILVDAGPGLRTAALSIVLGAGVWWWHWGVRARDDRGSTGWHIHLFLVGMLGGMAAALTGAGILVHRLIAWLLSAVDGEVVEHFDAVPAAVAGLLVGVAVWGHHRAVLLDRRTDRSQGWTGPQRAYEYLLTGVGVLTTAGGVATILALGIELALPTTALVGADGIGRRALATALALLVVGAPLWAWAWRRIQACVHHHPGERRSSARRALILGVFGLGTLTSVSALGTLLYTGLEAVFSGRWSIDVLAGQRWSLALVLTAGVIAAHYGLVLREDRRAMAPPTDDEGSAGPASVGSDPARARSGPAQAGSDPARVGSGPARIVVCAARPEVLARRLADQLDVAVDGWTRHDVTQPGTADGDDGDAVDLASLRARLEEIAAPEALVLVGPDGAWEVVAVGRMPARR